MKSKITKRIDFLGCPVDCLTCDELLDELKIGILKKVPPRVIQFVNANKVAMVRKDPVMGAILKRADFVLADGQPMLPMAAMLGQHIPERIDGIGLMKKLLGMAHREHFSVYLLGARQEILDECVRHIRDEFPDLELAGYRNGYFTVTEIPEIAAQIRSKEPDFLFLGMGSPMKERLADEWKNILGAHVIQGVGGSFDVIAGKVKRAPLWMQRNGIEWLFRIIQEPRRMFWRYVKTNGSCLMAFFCALGRSWLLPLRQYSSSEPRYSAHTLPYRQSLRPYPMSRHTRIRYSRAMRSRIYAAWKPVTFSPNFNSIHLRAHTDRGMRSTIRIRGRISKGSALH